jgi:hypothetical protein
MNSAAGTDDAVPSWRSRFEAPFPVAVRPGLGGGGDRSVMITQGVDGFSLQVWDGATCDDRHG